MDISCCSGFNSGCKVRVFLVVVRLIWFMWCFSILGIEMCCIKEVMFVGRFGI